MKRALMVLSAADRWTLKDGSQHPTGFWAEEFLVPFERFVRAGWDVELATPGGVAPQVDPKSLGLAAGLPKKRARMRRHLDKLHPMLSQPRRLEDIDDSVYDVVFYPGGHAPMEDLAVSTASGRLLARRMEANKPVALLCHSPAAALAAATRDGLWPFEGRCMTGLSNWEERLSGLASKAPWLLETKLREYGARYRHSFPFRPFVVVDGNLYTGQNPQSSGKLADRIIADLAA